MNYRLILIICIVSLASCSDWLDVKPKTEITSETLFSNEEGFEHALNGAYLTISSSGLYGKEMTYNFMEAAVGTYSFNTELVTENNIVAAKNHDYDNSLIRPTIDNIWSKIYNAIAELNFLLGNVKSSTVLDQEQKNMYEAEILGLRAFLHFDILRCFGPSNIMNESAKLDEITMPYVVKFDKQEELHLSVKDVLAKIHKDLENANTLFLQGDIDVKNKYRFSYWSSLLIKARAYMWSGELDKALPLLEGWIKNDSFSWMNEHIDFTTKSADKMFSKEIIFGVQYTNVEENLETNELFYPSDPKASTRLFYGEEIFDKLFEKESYGNVDLRRKRQFSNPMENKVSIEKHQGANDIAIIRKTEAYYMAVECIISDGLTDKREQAFSYINIVREKRKLPHLDLNITDQELMDEVIKEYYKEFCADGQVFYLHKRLGINKNLYTNVSLSPEELILPIPQAELDRAVR